MNATAKKRAGAPAKREPKTTSGAGRINVFLEENVKIAAVKAAGPGHGAITRYINGLIEADCKARGLLK